MEDRSANRSRTDWRADDLHLVAWDMENESGFFGGTAGLVAITPVDFVPSSGEILDVQIISGLLAPGHRKHLAAQ